MMKENENIYYKARKYAAIYNEKLYSREGAAELLGLSVSTLADYELGITKVVPVDKVVLMADLYNCPELKCKYCKKECPIGKCLPIATQFKAIESSVLKLVKELDSGNTDQIKKKIIDISADGIISDEEKPVLKEIIGNLDRLSVAISEVKTIAEKIMKE